MAHQLMKLYQESGVQGTNSESICFLSLLLIIDAKVSIHRAQDTCSAHDGLVVVKKDNLQI